MNEQEKNREEKARKLRLISQQDNSSGIHQEEDTEFFLRQIMDKNPREACGLLFKQYHAVLCNHAIRFVYSQRIAEDLVSDVFEKFWAQKRYAHVSGPYRNYLFISVRNACLNHLRAEFKNRGILELSRAEHQESNLNSPLQNIKLDEMSRIIETTVQSLPSKCKSVFLLSRFEGKSNKEIATVLDLSLKSIEAHMTRALTKLRKALQDEYL